MDGVQLPQGQSHSREAVYFLPLRWGSQVALPPKTPPPWGGSEHPQTLQLHLGALMHTFLLHSHSQLGPDSPNCNYRSPHAINHAEGVSFLSMLPKTTTRSFVVFYQLLHQQTSFFTNFQNFTQHQLSERKIFITNFPFITDSSKPSIPPALKGAKSAKHDKSFLLMLREPCHSALAI